MDFNLFFLKSYFSRFIFSLLCAFSIVNSFAQEKKDGVIQNGEIVFENTTLSIEKMIQVAADPELNDSLIVKVQNCSITGYMYSGLIASNDTKFKKDSLNRIVTNKKIHIRFIGDNEPEKWQFLQIADINFAKPIEIENFGSSVELEIILMQSEVRGLSLYTNEKNVLKTLSVHHCEFLDVVKLKVAQFKGISISNNLFKAIPRNPSIKFGETDYEEAADYLFNVLGYPFFPMQGVPWADTVVNGRRNVSLNRIEVESSFGEGFSFSENVFEPDSVHRNMFNLGKVDNLIVVDNKFDGDFILNKTEVASYIKMADNMFYSNSSICFSDFIFPDNGGKLYWDDFKGFRLGVMTNIYRILYKGKTDEELSNKKDYLELLKVYEHLYSLFKTNGDIESATACYVELKEMEGNRMKYLYKTQGGFRAFFTWKLNRLMKFYTDHGTDPAKAIVYSIWIIIFFGIFYFFFPSDWDSSSKKVLYKHFKEFIQKNEKGYIKPFLGLILGFLISLFNALTLSLNAFTTLGFGNIPTHGVARYVCVVQGFLGWFLLSLFTVALVNQALF